MIRESSNNFSPIRFDQFCLNKHFFLFFCRNPETKISFSELYLIMYLVFQVFFYKISKEGKICLSFFLFDVSCDKIFDMLLAF